MQNLRSKIFILLAFFVPTRTGTAPNSACAFLPRVYFFYDHTGAIGKAFAGIDLLRAHTRPGGSAEATSRRSWKAATFRAKAMGSEVVRLTALSRHHMQIVCISMTPQLLGTTAPKR